MKNTAIAAGHLFRLLGCGIALAGCGRADAVAEEGAVPGRTAGMLESIGPMSSSRAAHTATALPDGRVLLAGGFTREQTMPAGAEIFDPLTHRFVPTGPMRTPRYGHTATLLPDGTVLIVGGFDSRSEYLRDAELYDPASDAFAPAARMSGARAGHLAVALQDGRVLLLGGVGTGRTFLSSAELYDSATREFSSTGAMTVPRENHAAVRLPDGRVLVTGGHAGRRPSVILHNSAEIYDPATGTFAGTGSMELHRHKHDAVLLADGRVLITGGADERDSQGMYASAELYDPHTATFSATGAMQLPRYKHQGTSIVLSDGRVLLAGGSTQAEIYDPGTGTFTLVGGAARLAGQYSASTPLAGDQVLITGGYGRNVQPQPTAWLFRP